MCYGYWSYPSCFRNFEVVESVEVVFGISPPFWKRGKVRNCGIRVLPQIGMALLRLGGHLGGMIYGSVTNKNVFKNDETIWYRGKSDRNNPHSLYCIIKKFGNLF